jgi:hypothetical protein
LLFSSKRKLGTTTISFKTFRKKADFANLTFPEPFTAVQSVLLLYDDTSSERELGQGNLTEGEGSAR